MLKFSVQAMGFVIPVLTTAIVLAQHDAHRNATQQIATGDLEGAAQQLAKADKGDPETLFVQMMVDLKAQRVDAAVESAAAALDASLPFERLVAGPRELLDTLHKTEDFKAWQKEHGAPVLIHGPMVGGVTDSAASFWVRTAREADVQIKIGDRVSEVVKATPDSDFTALATVTGLAPSKEYDYQVLIDSEPAAAENTTFTTFPKAGGGGRFSVAFGGGAGYVPRWEYMWDTINKFNPSALLMLGDNVYIDQPQHSLCQDYCYYRRQSRPEWRRLVASTSVYAIYDDHDFGTNDCVPGPEIESPLWKRTVWNRFRQNWVNPSYGGGEKQPGCWHNFHIGDVHFIMLDGRYYRDRKSRSMLGPAQKRWLLDTLKESQGTFKVLASPVPFTEGIKPGSRDPWDGYPEEREEIFSFIEDNKIDGVFLVAADRHRTDLRTTPREKGYDLYEFESSRLTNRHTHSVVKTPGLIWGYNKTCSFGLVRFDTASDQPKVTFECITIDGEVIHRHELLARELRYQ